MRTDSKTAARIAPLLKEAIEAQIRVDHLIGQMEEIVAGEGCEEWERESAENVILEYVLDVAAVSETAEGIDADDAKTMFLELTA